MFDSGQAAPSHAGLAQRDVRGGHHTKLTGDAFGPLVFVPNRQSIRFQRHEWRGQL